MDTCSDLACECNCHRRKDSRCTTNKCGAWGTNQPPTTDISKYLPKSLLRKSTKR